MTLVELARARRWRTSVDRSLVSATRRQHTKLSRLWRVRERDSLCYARSYDRAIAGKIHFNAEQVFLLPANARRRERRLHADKQAIVDDAAALVIAAQFAC